MLAYGRLLRLSLAPSAVADVAAGIVLAAGAWPGGGAPFLLMLASLCVYHGGMALNDWADREEDARGNRPRPIPSGAIAPSSALALAGALLLLGPTLAAFVSAHCGLVLGAVALCAALYDLAGRGPWRGPFLLALCRAGNLGVGLAFASAAAPLRPALLAAPLVYGLYVFLVSRLARLEDTQGEELRPAPRVIAMACALIALGGVAAYLVFASGATGILRRLGFLAVALTLLGARGLLRAVRDLGPGLWRAGDVQGVAGMGLRRLLVASASLALGACTLDGLIVAALILCGYPLSFALRKLFPPT